MPTNLYGSSGCSIRTQPCCRRANHENADTTKPDDIPGKAMDVSKLVRLGKTAQTKFKDGVKSAYSWSVDNRA
jgi:nucleoside-diphosphate-sugar epimerase